MIHTYTYKKVSWIDLENPTQEETRELSKKYGIDPLAAEELLSPTTRSRVDAYNDFVFMAMRFPAWKHSHKESSQEIDFIVGRDFIVTARYDTIDSLHKFEKMFEVNSVLDKNGLIGEHAGYMFYYMIREIYRSLGDELDSIDDSLGEIEKKTFSGNERAMVFELSETSREILSFKHAFSLHKDLLESFGAAAKKMFGKDFEHYVTAIKSEYAKIEKFVSDLSESLSEIRDTNDSLLEAKQNKIMLTFTSVTIISSFLNIMASWSLVDSADNPVRHNPNEFWLVGFSMLLVGLILAGLMRVKKWL